MSQVDLRNSLLQAMRCACGDQVAATYHGDLDGIAYRLIHGFQFDLYRSVVGA